MRYTALPAAAGAVEYGNFDDHSVQAILGRAEAIATSVAMIATTWCFASTPIDVNGFKATFAGETFNPNDRGRGASWFRWRK